MSDVTAAEVYANLYEVTKHAYTYAIEQQVEQQRTIARLLDLIDAMRPCVEGCTMDDERKAEILAAVTVALRGRENSS